MTNEKETQLIFPQNHTAEPEPIFKIIAELSFQGGPGTASEEKKSTIVSTEAPQEMNAVARVNTSAKVRTLRASTSVNALH